MNRLVVAVFSWLTMAFTFMGLGSLITPGPWLAHLFWMSLLITAAMWAIAGWGTRHRVLAGAGSILIGILVWLVYLCAIASGGSGLGRMVPTPAALQAVMAHVNAAVAALPEYVRPANNPELFLPLALAGLGPMCVLGVFLALGARRPVWLGLPALACWVVFLSGGPDAGIGWLAAAGAVYLLLVSRSPAKRRAAGRFQGVAVPIAIVSAVLGLLIGVVAPVVPGWGQSSGWLSFWVTGNDNTGINLQGPVQVSDNLHDQSSVPLFSTLSDTAVTLKVESLNTFDGTTWQWNPGTSVRYQAGQLVGDSYVTTQRPSGAPSRGRNIPPAITTVTSPLWSSGPSVSVKIDQLSGLLLPTGIGPRSVEPTTTLGMRYNPVLDSVAVTPGLTTGDTYATDTMVLDRNGLGPVEPAEQIGSVIDPAWMSVPHIEQIRDLTSGIIASFDARTCPYCATRQYISQDDALRAIQNYLANGSFTYTLTPKWRTITDDPVWDFLTNKQGYCVHFATAMAAMAGSVGIPMRVSVGYLPGTLGDDGWRTVTGAQAHMWPEAYYPGIGWVPYEPTPSVGTSVLVEEPTDSAQPTELPNTSDLPTTDASQVLQPEPSPTAGPSQGTTVAAGQESKTWYWVAGSAGGLAGIAVIVGLAWIIYIRRYRPEQAWQAIHRRGVAAGVLDQGMSVRAATTVLARRDPTLAPGLDALRQNLELARYAPPGPVAAALPGLELWNLKRAVVRSLRRTPARHTPAGQTGS